MSRGGFKISRVSEDESAGDRVDWLDSFTNKLQTLSSSPVAAAVNAVEAARARDSQSIVDQITAIVSNKKVHSTVASLVDEYQDRTGLKAYLKRMSEQSDDGQKKVAQEATPGQPSPAQPLPAQQQKPVDAQLPVLFQKLTPTDAQDVKAFIRNKCESHFGNVLIPALVEEVSKTFSQKGVQPQDVDDPLFEKFISDEIVRAKKMFPVENGHNPNLGRGVGTDVKTQEKIDVYDALTPSE